MVNQSNNSFPEYYFLVDQRDISLCKEHKMVFIFNRMKSHYYGRRTLFNRIPLNWNIWIVRKNGCKRRGKKNDLLNTTKEKLTLQAELSITRWSQGMMGYGGHNFYIISGKGSQRFNRMNTLLRPFETEKPIFGTPHCSTFSSAITSANSAFIMKF